MAKAPARRATAPQKKPAARKLATPTDLSTNQVSDVHTALNGLLANAYALYLKTKNFHWHVSGPHFREYHLLFDDHATEILATTDLIAERVRKLGGTTLRSIGHIARLQTVKDNDADFVSPADMLRELTDDNRAYVEALRQASDVCDKAGDTATASLIDDWLDQAEQRVWFLFETSRTA
jgi:starvation-inducible DNA-binding protein